MIERLFLACILLAAIVACGVVVRLGVRLWQRRAFEQQALPPVGRPILLYFSGPYCTTCRMAQEPALQRLEQRYRAGYELRHIDASLDTLLAQRFGVLTVPTTVILDADGVVRAINNGYASEQQLAAQLGL